MKFSKLHDDSEIRQYQQEIQDNLADKSEINSKKTKLIDIQKTEPKLTDMSDGDQKSYYDGTNYWKYERIGAKLFKTQLTEVI